jgi:hypothetical protein
MCINGHIYSSNKAFLRPHQEQQYIIQIEKRIKWLEKTIKNERDNFWRDKTIGNAKVKELEVERKENRIEYNRNLQDNNDDWVDVCHKERLKEWVIQKELQAERDTLKAENERLTGELELVEAHAVCELEDASAALLLAGVKESANRAYKAMEKIANKALQPTPKKDKHETTFGEATGDMTAYNKKYAKMGMMADKPCPECNNTGKVLVQQRYTDREYLREVVEEDCDKCKSKKEDASKIPAEMIITEKTFRTIIDLIENPPKPTKALKRLFEIIPECIRDDN